MPVTNTDGRILLPAAMATGDGAALDVWLKSRLDAVNDAVGIVHSRRYTVFNAAGYATDFLTVAASDYNIRDGNAHLFGFYQGQSGYSLSELYLYSTLDQACTVTLALPNLAGTGVGPLLYTESANLAATTGALVLTPYAGGTGAASTVKIVPALAGALNRFILSVTAASSPSSGTLSIRLSQRT